MTLPLSLTPDDLTDDALTDRVRVLQRRNGHRYSVDDVATAWLALRAAPAARSCLDLGCGIGSVLLMVADRLPGARAVGVEAQAGSYALAERNIEKNRLGRRVCVQYGDLRDPALLDRILQAEAAFGHEGGFHLVTGTPPYKPLGTASISPDPQRAHARIELRGGVEAYLAAAARVLAPEGVFVMCAQNEQTERVTSGARAVRLRPVYRVDVITMQERKGRLFSVWVFMHEEAVEAADGVRARLSVLQPLAATQNQDQNQDRDQAQAHAQDLQGIEESAVRARPEQPPASATNIPYELLVLRDQQGARTAAACALRAYFGLVQDPNEPASPPRRSDERRSLARAQDNSVG